MASINEATVTEALFVLLDGALSDPIGDHGTKDRQGTAIDTSGTYHVLRRIDGGGVEGSYGDPHQDLTLVYQVDTAARSRAICEGAASLVVAAMTDIAPSGGHVHTLAGTGWVGGLRTRQTLGMPSPEGLDEQGNVGVWVQRERYEVTVHRA